MALENRVVLSEREVFTIARELTNPSDRAQYLAQISDQDPVLAQRVRQLLLAHNTVNSLLDVPIERQPEEDSARSTVNTLQFLDSTPLLSDVDHETPHEPLGQVPGFEIEGVLGRGGMSVVYKAEQLALKRTVALKMMLAGVHASAEQRARFRIEAEAVARLQHPNIVQIHEVGESAGVPYCALEYVEGGTLAQRLDSKPISPRDAAKLVETLARAMQLAHSRNVIHRDLKSSNIMMTLDGVPKITDFGLARQLDRDTGATHTGVVMGTPSYMAPEQASGHAHEAGPAADVYALGAILYDCLTGQPPFKGDSVTAILEQVRSQEPPPPSRLAPGISIDLETICLKCLRKEPEKRYASASELAEELARFQNGEPILARPIGNTELTMRWVKRNPMISTLIGTVAALIVLLGIGGVIAGVVFSRQAQEQKVLAEQAERAKQFAEDEQKKARIAADLATAEASRATQVTKFLQGLFEPRDLLAVGFMNMGFQKKQSGLMANDLLKAGVEKLNGPGGLKDRPIVRAELLYNIGTIYMGLGQTGEAQPLLEESLQLRRANLPANHLDLARSLQAVADIRSLTDNAAVIPLYTEAIDILKSNRDADELELAMFETRFGLFMWYLNAEPEEPKRLLQHAYEIRKRKYGDDHLQTIGTLMVLTLITVEAQQNAEGLKMILQMVTSLQKSEGPTELKEFGTRLIASLQTIAMFGEKAALDQNRKLLAQTILVFGEDHFITIRVRSMLVWSLFYTRDHQSLTEAIQQSSECVQSLQRSGIKSQYWEANARFQSVRCYRVLGRSNDAIVELRKIIELIRPVQSQLKNRQIVPHAMTDLALFLQLTNDPKYHDEITRLEEDAYEYCQANPKVDLYRRGHTLLNVAHWRLYRGDFKSCIPVAREAAEFYQKTPGAGAIFEAEAQAMLFHALKQQGLHDESEKARKRAQEISEYHANSQEPAMNRARQLLQGTIPSARP